MSTRRRPPIAHETTPRTNARASAQSFGRVGPGTPTIRLKIRSSVIRRAPFQREAGPFRRQRINFDIRITPIRLIDQDNNQIGVIDTSEAMRMAQEAGLDLVEIQPDVRPPVCKIMDYGKYKFEMSKKERGNRAASKQAEMKEVRLGRSQKVDDHDVGIRVNQARRFLIDGHKVQIVQQFRGREMAHRDIAINRFKDVVASLADISKVEQTPRQLGRRMSLILAPDKPKIEAIKRKQLREANAEQREAERQKQLAEEARIAALDAAEDAESGDDHDDAEDLASSEAQTLEHND